MSRTYNIALVAVTIGATPKWVDNLLSHHDIIVRAPRGRQGVQRRITDEGLLAIELTRLLSHEFGVPLGRAANLSRKALESKSGSEARIATDSGVTLVFNLTAIEHRL